MNISRVIQPLRTLGMAHFIDKLKFYHQKFKYQKANQEYQQNHPHISFPPDYLLFESFQLNYQKYYEGGRDSAEWIKSLLDRHMDLKSKHILDWGCGPARILRHLPTLINNDCQFYGTDYNERTIKWCQENLPSIQFSTNQLQPPLTYATEQFDAIYGISIFTHLSEANHSKWFNELCRVAKPGAVLILTTQGAAFKAKLTSSEQARFDAGNLVVRSKAREGHRVFAAFHPTIYMQQLFEKRVSVLEHITW